MSYNDYVCRLRMLTGSGWLVERPCLKTLSWLRRAEQRASEKRGNRIGGSLCLLIRFQIRSEISSPHLRLTSWMVWADRSIQEDAEDAEDAEKKDRLASSGYGRDWLKGWPYDAAIFAGVCCHIPHPIDRPCSPLNLPSPDHRHHHDPRLWDKSSFEPSRPALHHQRRRVENLASGCTERTQGLIWISATTQIWQNRVEGQV